MNPKVEAAAAKVNDLIDDSLPVDLERLAGLLGASIYEEKLEENVSGMLIKSKSSNNSIIVVNKLHHINRKRFTIAHELSHLLMHGDSNTDFVDSIGTSTIYFRSQDSSDKLKEMEQEANELAGIILMPEKNIKRLINYNPVDINDDAGVKMLAKKVGVSVQALSIRLSKLNFSDWDN